MTPQEKREQIQRDKAKARIAAAGLALPEALGGTGDAPRDEQALELDLSARVDALEARLEALESQNSELEKTIPAASGYACGCDPGVKSSSPHRPLIRFYACESYPDCAYGQSQSREHVKSEESGGDA